MSDSLGVTIAGTAAGARIQALLSSSGAVGSTVTDILTAAEDVAAIADTANASLSTFQAAISDPIQVSFNNGQQYAGSFITAPTASLIPLEITEQALASSTIGVALLSAAQIAALVVRTGISIVNDVDLAQAMAALFNEHTSNLQIGFSINLFDSSAFTNYNYTPAYNNSYTIIPLSPNPSIESLTYFTGQVSGYFPNTPNIGGVIASIWVDGLGISVSATGAEISGIPGSVDPNLYADITGNAVNFGAPTPTITVDYSYQQNYFNTVIALSIDNGLSTTFTGLMSNPLVNDTTRQVIKNRLPAAALRGDTGMVLAMIQALGATDVPNKTSLLASIITGANPSDAPSTIANPITFYAGGSQITTTTAQKTLADTTTDLNAIATTLGVTAQDAFTQNTCDSILCNQSLLNVAMVKAANQKVLNQLFSPTIIAMANLF